MWCWFRNGETGGAVPHEEQGTEGEGEWRHRLEEVTESMKLGEEGKNKIGAEEDV